MTYKNKADLVTQYGILSKGCQTSFLNEILKPTGKKGDLLNDDYIRAICVLAELEKAQIDPTQIVHYKDLVGKLSPDVMYRLKYDQPCLACRIDELKGETNRYAVKNSSKWIYTEKINGVRATMVLIPGKKPSFFGRFTGEDGGLINYAEKIHYATPLNSIKASAAVDVEIFLEPNAETASLFNIVSVDEERTTAFLDKAQLCESLLTLNDLTAIQLQQDYLRRTGRSLLNIYIIHPLFYKKVDYINAPIIEGRKVLQELFEELQSIRLPCRLINHVSGGSEAKQAFLESILSVKGEGIVAYNLDGIYAPGRSKNTWVKIKSSSTINLTDTIDGFITGYKSNDKVVTHLEVSTFIQKEGYEVVHKIANVPLSKTHSILFTEYIGPSPVLKSDMYGQVVELAGSHFDASGRMVQAKLVKFKASKTKKDCLVSLEYIAYFTRK